MHRIAVGERRSISFLELTMELCYKLLLNLLALVPALNVFSGLTEIGSQVKYLSYLEGLW